GRKPPHFVAPGIEEVTTEKEAHGRFFMRQLFLQVPRRDLGKLVFDDVIAVISEQRHLIGATLSLLSRIDSAADGCQQRRAVAVDRVERARANQGLDRTAIHRVPVDAPAKIKEAFEWAVLGARTDDFLDGALSCALNR